MSDKNGTEIPWWAIVLGFMLPGLWPVGLILLFLNLGGVRIPTEKIKREFQSGTQRRQTPPSAAQGTSYAQHTYTGQGQSQGRSGQTTQRRYVYGQTPPPHADPRRTQGAGQTGAGTAQKPGKSKVQRWKRSPKSGKLLTVLGGLFSFIFGLGFINEFIDAWRYGLLAYADELFPIFGFLCAGLVMLWTGVSRTRLSRRQRLYMGVIGNRNSVFLSDLAGAAGVSEKRVAADLQKMLADGVLPMGYIDRASGRLVLTDQGYEPAPEPKTEPREEPPKKEAEDDAILREIKAVNDAIPGEEMTRKIDRIGEITKRILDYQRQNPAKAGELRQFLNYYLPTTLKLLKTYAQLDAQGVEGENITAAKQRIEGMMDKVVEGFEKQLDQLFQTDALDIASDVEVLERMLEKDGLGSGMTMGS